MKLRSPFLIKTAALLGATVVSRLLATIDFRCDLSRAGRQPIHPREARYIYAFWHDSMLLPTLFRARAHILISQHADGELIAQLVKHFRFDVVRGSTSRGGAAALMNLMAVSKRSHLCITPDGPRGPRRQVQPGAVFLAAQTQLPIIPVGIGYANAWRAKSWDQFAVPKPFSRAALVAGEPIVVPSGLELRKTLDYMHVLQESLTDLSAEAERWAAGLPRIAPPTAAFPLAKSA